MKFFKTLAMMTLALGMTFSTSYAAVTGYVIEYQDQLYKYDSQNLINSMIGLSGSEIYDDFNLKLSQNAKFHSFIDGTTERYIDYNGVVSSFMNEPEGFNLNAFVEDDMADEVQGLPATIKNVYVNEFGEVDEEDVSTGESTGEDEQDLYSVDIKMGLTAFDRLVEVEVFADNPQDYEVSVAVEGKTVVLDYIASAGVFRGVVSSTDEAAIEAGVVVEDASGGNSGEEEDFTVIDIQ